MTVIEQVKSFSNKEVELVEELLSGGFDEFQQWFAEFETDWRENLAEAPLFWLAYEDKQFEERYSYLKKVEAETVEVTDDVYEELMAELEFYREESEALMAVYDVDTVETDFGKKLVKAFAGDRQNDVWRYYEEGVDDWLKEQGLYQWQHEWQEAGLPELTYKTGKREDGSTFSYSVWPDWARQAEADRCEFIRLLTAYLHCFDEQLGYGYAGNRPYWQPEVNKRRGEELLAFVKSKS